MSSALPGSWDVGGGSPSTQLSNWDAKHHFDCVFPGGPVVATAFRAVALATSYGQVPDAAGSIADQNSTGYNYGPKTVPAVAPTSSTPTSLTYATLPAGLAVGMKVLGPNVGQTNGRSLITGISAGTVTISTRPASRCPPWLGPTRS